MTPALDIAHSISGQPWHWRGGAIDGLSGDFQPDDLVTGLLLSRGCDRSEIEAYRTPTIRSFMPDPSIFRDMDQAAQRIVDAIETQEKVTIFGDYDVDGATSAALLIRLLRDLGLEAGYYIPDRLMEGYGPSGEALVKLAEQGSSLIVTVDCGAQAFEALQQARDAGVDVIVVDHHKCASDLPVAHSLVNPNRLDEDEGAAHGHLAAVGVAFLLAAAIVRQLRAKGYFENRPEPKLIELLDIVALGTVADVAALRGLNRAFVAQGLKVMAAQRNVGINALIKASRLDRAPIASDLGFRLGPRINAGGRVGKSDLGVRLLTTQNPEEADAIAAELEHFNEERRAIEAAVTEQAIELGKGQDNRSVALVSAKGWHPGVIGIVASRLKEKLHRPTIVIALDDEGIGKGSGRSVAGADLGSAILAAKDNGLLIAGGGHPMAAGLTIAEDKIDALAEFLDSRLANDVSESRGARALQLDAVVAPGGVTPAFVNALEEGGPYGMGWPAPRIATGPVRVIKADIVGTDHVRAIVAGEDGRSLKTIAFRAADTPLGQAILSAGNVRKLWVAGRAKIDDWGPRPAAELHLEDAAWVD
ncbi:single-stranded-DNA-specific exonuclease RecJ [Parasphingopyxis sp. CP4]|uniref:single-stranded-DNA-specific exonuclease RecJ n=1 Tax=Parasphingopyxis sp. CP4 TaxID=2724527 RepID=UPI0015A06ED0|nr:single-stranded-DNA-specific exonuclease RecJ [Parasphingopyxis sp. CP4]QLC22158.1 single-stranded-DNA-specific exonuclease RecJ [Parasphingopyxis sp. CP4]